MGRGQRNQAAETGARRSTKTKATPKPLSQVAAIKEIEEVATQLNTIVEVVIEKYPAPGNIAPNQVKYLQDKWRNIWTAWEDASSETAPSAQDKRSLRKEKKEMVRVFEEACQALDQIQFDDQGIISDVSSDLHFSGKKLRETWVRGARGPVPTQLAAMSLVEAARPMAALIEDFDEASKYDEWWNVMDDKMSEAMVGLSEWEGAESEPLQVLSDTTDYLDNLTSIVEAAEEARQEDDDEALEMIEEEFELLLDERDERVMQLMAAAQVLRKEPKAETLYVPESFTA